jgi:uncharacterized protein (DUF2267 family)/pterin-4a-carbinolamine dehydratase
VTHARRRDEDPGNVTYEQFVTEVAARLGVAPPGRVALLTRSVFAALSAQLSPEDRNELAQALPSSLADIVRSTIRTERRDPLELVHDVATGSVNTTPERARYGIQAVLSALDALASDTGKRLRADLPPDYADLFVAPGDGPPPDLAASAAENVPTELSDADIGRALRRLPGWGGDRSALSRTVSLPPGIDRPMLARIHAAEQEMQHHAVIETSGRDTTFRVWTHSIGCVTELDVALAGRIQQVIEEP